MALTINIEPKNFRQAMEDEVWKNSMQSEMDALERNHKWDLQELPPGKTALGTKWVYTIKLRADGTIELHR